MVPHVIGSELCRSEERRCESRGAFFGLGWTVDVRLRVLGPLVAHARPWVVANVAQDRIYTGATGLGLGLGLYGNRAFVRGEYSPIFAFGSSAFTPPFFDSDVGRDTWGNHAGMVAVGFRQPVREGIRLELWGGPMFGPRAERTQPGERPNRRVLITFMIGLGASFDIRRPN